MHKETYDITSVGDAGTITLDDYFEIDEIIALPIQVLNRKGYITIGCCAGHSFKQLIESDSAYAKKLSELLGVPLDKTKYIETLKITSGDTHIAFKEGIFLPSLPPGFTVDNPGTEAGSHFRITGGFADISDTFKALRDILETMEQLYKWALDLSDFKP